MEVRIAPAMTVVYSRHRTTIMQLGQLAGTAVKELYKEIFEKGWLISGTQLWIYHGADGKPGTEFTLDIAVPVIGDTSQSRFPIKKLEPLKAITHLHEFGWETMGAAYGQIMQYAAMNNLKLTSESREIYLNVDFNEPANNRTEIQVGVQ